MPKNMIFKACPYCYKRFGVTKENWMNSKTRARVESELEKIKAYLAKGDIIEI